jgi:hypothetical protein
MTNAPFASVDDYRWKGTELVLANYPVDTAEDIQRFALRPWEACVYRMGQVR